MGFEQALVVFVGKLRVNRQPHGLAAVGSARQANRKVHPVFVAGARGHLHGVLLWCEHLLEERGQLRFAKHASGFHVGQQVFEVTHALCQVVHFAQTFVHLLKALGHLFEALAQAGLQGGLQFFVNRLAHLVQFGSIALLQLRQLGFHGAAHLGQAAGVGLRQRIDLLGQAVGQAFLQQGQLLGQCVNLLVLGTGGLGALLQQRLLEQRERLHGLLSALHARLTDLGAQLALQSLGLGLQGSKLLLLPGRLFGQLIFLRLRCGFVAKQQDQEPEQVQPTQRQPHPFTHRALPGTVFSGVRAWPRVR